MKSSKLFISILCYWGTMVSSAQTTFNFSYSPTNDYVSASYTSSTVSTPNSSSVSVYQWVSNDWTQATKTYMVGYYQGQYGNRLTVESEATVKYNCHAWAWAGNTGVWMNRPEETQYWNDWSYISVSIPSTASKVSYGSIDHSAGIVTSSTFRSKWGAAPRFTHAVNDCPYDASSITRYKRYTAPPYYVSTSFEDFSGNGSVSANGTGYATFSMTVFKNPTTSTNPNSYVWSVDTAAPCDRYYLYGNGSSAYINVYFTGQSGGTFRLECKVYNGSTLLNTAYYYLAAYP